MPPKNTCTIENNGRYNLLQMISVPNNTEPPMRKSIKQIIILEWDTTYFLASEFNSWLFKEKKVKRSHLHAFCHMEWLSTWELVSPGWDSPVHHTFNIGGFVFDPGRYRVKASDYCTFDLERQLLNWAGLYLSLHGSFPQTKGCVNYYSESSSWHNL